MHFAELSSGSINQTELVALLIIQGKNFKEGIENVYNRVKGSCSMLILTEDGIICARDKWGRTPIVIGKKEGAWAATSETTAFANLDYEVDRYVGPGEIIRIRQTGCEVMKEAERTHANLLFPLGLLRFPYFNLRRTQRGGSSL